MKKTLCIIGALLLALPVVAQVPAGPTTFGGRVDALSFAYGAAGQGAALVLARAVAMLAPATPSP